MCHHIQWWSHKVPKHYFGHFQLSEVHVDGTSRLARYNFLLVFYSDVMRGIHGFWDTERQSQKVTKHVVNSLRTVIEQLNEYHWTFTASLIAFKNFNALQIILLRCTLRQIKKIVTKSHKTKLVSKVKTTGYRNSPKLSCYLHLN